MKERLQVLIVEDDSDDAELLVGELRKAGFIPTWQRVETEPDFLAAIKNRPDIILSDYSLPQFNGVRAAELLRDSGFDIPFILISGTVGEEVAVAAMKMGATDYLLKDRIARLGSAVERGLREAQANAERKRVELVLIATQGQLQRTLEHNPAVIYSLKVAAGCLIPQMVSENIIGLLGYKAEECLTFEWWAERLHPADRDRQFASIPETLESGALAFEYRLRHRAGHYVWLEDHRRTLRDAAGTPVEISGVWLDITARKRTERDLETLHRSHQLILDSVVEGIHGIDLTGSIVFENAASTKIFGWESNEFVGQSAHALMHHSRADGSPLPLDQCRIHATLHDGLTRRVDDEVFWRKDGTNFPVEYVVAPKRDEIGAIVGAVVVFHNISERRNLENQFRQAQKMESIGLLAGGIAHDFNNLLAVIMMQAELTSLVADNPPEVRLGLLEIAAAADLAANLTRQLLLFGRRQVMQSTWLDLNELVTSLAKMLRRLIGEDVCLELLLEAGKLLMRADPGMLEQVVMNLVVNARDALPNGGQITIATASRSVAREEAELNLDAEPGRYACLSVCDTGCGIPAEIQSRIFEPFFTTKEAGKGTGLGLATVFGIVKQHKGWLKMHSEVGKGTTFQIFLPTGEKPTERISSRSQNQSKPRGGSETILVVEDDDSLRKLTSLVLQRNGYQVLEARDGVSAQCAWASHQSRISLLLTDLVMPGGFNGRELATLVTQQRPGLKILFTSGYSAEIAGRELKLEPGQNFLQKPYPPEQLLMAVRNSLDG